MVKHRHRLIRFLLGVGVLMVVPVPGTFGAAPRSVGFGAGTNFYGSVVTATFEQPITSRFFAGVGLAWGSLEFHFPPGSNFFGYRNRSGYDIQFYLDANYDVDLYVGAKLFRGRKWTLLPEIAVGWSWFDLSYENIIRIPSSARGDYRGVRELQNAALFTRLGILEYRPSPRGFFANLGIQARTAFLWSPLVLTTVNGVGDTYNVWAGNPTGGWLVIPLPDLFIRLGYSF